MQSVNKSYCTYDLKNRLIKVTKSDGTVVEYTYDAMDQRIGSKVADKGTSFLMSGMIEYARNDGEVQYHTLGLDLVGSLEATGATGSILASGNQAYLYDGNGNVTAAITYGAITDQLAYEPFGKQTSNVNLPFTFSSKYTDISGLTYYGVRYYDNSCGRWINRDPIMEIGGINQYAFVKNHLISSFDIRGAFSLMVECEYSKQESDTGWTYIGYRPGPSFKNLGGTTGAGSSHSMLFFYKRVIVDEYNCVCKCPETNETKTRTKEYSYSVDWTENKMIVWQGIPGTWPPTPFNPTLLANLTEVAAKWVLDNITSSFVLPLNFTSSDINRLSSARIPSQSVTGTLAKDTKVPKIFCPQF